MFAVIRLTLTVDCFMQSVAHSFSCCADAMASLHRPVVVPMHLGRRQPEFTTRLVDQYGLRRLPPDSGTKSNVRAPAAVLIRPSERSLLASCSTTSTLPSPQIT
jgi:hypothetical protein